MVTLLESLPRIDLEGCKAYRLINSKYPPIALFDDVANEDEFEAMYALQAMTNPRLLNEVGDYNLVPQQEIPFGILGCSYAVAPFTHVNPDGSRFSDGQFGVLYVADTMETAIKEVSYHQEKYWRGVPDLNYERFVFRGLVCTFSARALFDATTLDREHAIYASEDYSASRAFGAAVRKSRGTGIQYHSVRHQEATCWALFTPRVVTSMIQTRHYEFVWDGQNISNINKISSLR
jgi:hypothetical protein